MDSVNNKHAELDKYILNALAAGKHRHGAVCADAEVAKQVAPFVTVRTSVSRIVENRMRSMARKGIVKYNRTDGWRINV